MCIFKKKIKCPKCGEKTPKDGEFCNHCGANLKQAAKVRDKTEEATAVTDDIIKHRGFFGRIIPQYRGYKRREVRRISDKVLRDHLVKELTKAKDTIKMLEEGMIDNAPEIVEDLEKVLMEMDTFVNKINHADYGYMETGTRALRIGEDEIERLLDFDKATIETVIEIQDLVDALTDTVNTNEILELRKKLRAATTAYEQRDEYMRGFES